MAVHGDITEVRYSHPTLGSGVFFAKAKEANSYDPGGIRSEDDANKISGGGGLIDTKNRVRGFFEIVVEDDMNIQESALKAAALAASPVHATWTVSLLNGTVWKGTGPPVGDIQPDTDAGTFPLKVVSAEFVKIVG